MYISDSINELLQFRQLKKGDGKFWFYSIWGHW